MMYRCIKNCNMIYQPEHRVFTVNRDYEVNEASAPVGDDTAHWATDDMGNQHWIDSWIEDGTFQTVEWFSILYTKMDEVCEKFDFETVHNIMKLMEWRYYTDRENAPTILELQSTVRQLLHESVKEKFNPISSGGFTCEVTKDGEVKVRFVPVHTFGY